MNVTTFKTMNYEQITMNNPNKNKPNSNPITPAQYAIRDTKYKPNQTQPVVSLSNLFQRQKNAEFKVLPLFLCLSIKSFSSSILSQANNSSSNYV